MKFSRGDRVKVATFCGESKDIANIAKFYGEVGVYDRLYDPDLKYAVVEINGERICINENSLVLLPSEMFEPNFDLKMISEFLNVYNTLNLEEKELAYKFMELVRSKVEGQYINRPGTLAVVVDAALYKENIGRLVNVHHIARCGEVLPDGFVVDLSIDSICWVVSARSGKLRCPLSYGGFVDKEYGLVMDEHIRPVDRHLVE